MATKVNPQSEYYRPVPDMTGAPNTVKERLDRIEYRNWLISRIDAKDFGVAHLYAGYNKSDLAAVRKLLGV